MENKDYISMRDSLNKANEFGESMYKCLMDTIQIANRTEGFFPSWYGSKQDFISKVKKTAVALADTLVLLFDANTNIVNINVNK